MRKVVVKGNITEERIYFGSFEIFRKLVNSSLNTETETVHISDDKQRIATIDFPFLEGGQGDLTIRYQLSDHLGSASLELDENAEIISYEEYYPFGSTSYRSGTSETEVSQKRYKYVMKELDNETGLYYYGARYYAAWLGRWTAVDPMAEERIWLSPYQYAQNSPIIMLDPNGMLDDWYQSSDGQLLWKEGTEKSVTLASRVDNEGNVLETKTYNWVASDGTKLGNEGANVIITGEASEYEWQRDIINIANNSSDNTVLAIGNAIKAMENVTSSFGEVTGVTMRDHSSGWGVRGVFQDTEFDMLKEKINDGSIAINSNAEFFFLGCGNSPLAGAFTSTFGYTSYGATGQVGPNDSFGSFRSGDNDGTIFNKYSFEKSPVYYRNKIETTKLGFKHIKRVPIYRKKFNVKPLNNTIDATHK